MDLHLAFVDFAVTNCTRKKTAQKKKNKEMSKGTNKKLNIISQKKKKYQIQNKIPPPKR